MRKGTGLLALCCGVLAVSVAWGQTSGFMGRVNPITTVNRPIDTSNVVGAPPTFSQGFSLPNLFRRVRTPAFPPVVGQSNYPKPSSFPSTQYKNAFNPLKPIVPKN
jgi:hypothetical protein